MSHLHPFILKKTKWIEIFLLKKGNLNIKKGRRKSDKNPISNWYLSLKYFLDLILTLTQKSIWVLIFCFIINSYAETKSLSQNSKINLSPVRKKIVKWPNFFFNYPRTLLDITEDRIYSDKYTRHSVCQFVELIFFSSRSEIQ